MAKGGSGRDEQQGGESNRSAVSKQEIVQATRTGKGNKNGKSEVGRDKGNNS